MSILNKEIEINQNNASQYIREMSKVRWKLYARNIKFSILVIFIVGFIFYISGRGEGADTTVSDYKYNKEQQVYYVHSIKNNYHFFTGLGIAFMIVSLFLAYQYLLRGKKIFFKSVNKVADRHKLSSENYLIRINSNHVYYEDSEIKREEQWNVFSKYRDHRDFLFLYREEHYLNCLSIDKRTLSSTELSDLMQLVGSKINVKM
jgi:hypothetical protein